VRDAARTWTQTGKSALSIQVERTPDWKLSASNLNLVTFTDTEPFDTGLCDKTLYIACTLVFHNDATGEIPMVKIAFNPYKQHSSLGKKGVHDLGVVLLHEIGHAIGLDHSAALDAIMSPVVELELPTGSAAARRLSSDDIATAAMAYPLPEPVVPPSFLAGAVMRDGLAIAKAHVVAFDKTGRTAAAGLTNGDGRFQLRVEPGEYRLAVEPLDGPVLPVQTWSEQPAPAAATEELAENIAEDIFKATTGKVESTARGATVTECRMAKLVVLGAFLRIGKNRIGFGNLLEFFFCLFVAWIAVRMILQC
jgi:hypothetical protein